MFKITLNSLPEATILIKYWIHTFLTFFYTATLSLKGDTKELPTSYNESLTADFATRDNLPETTSPRAISLGKWHWGPMPRTYPEASIPKDVDVLQWNRDRVIAVAKKYIGLPYKHRHIPSQGGLDCSNFTAWVYNYGFGIRFSSSIQKQSQVVGRKLLTIERLQPGDLIFIWNKTKTRISHVVIYVNDGQVIDSTKNHSFNGVALRPFKGWYLERYAYARRIF